MSFELDILEELRAIRVLLEEINRKLPCYPVGPVPMPDPCPQPMYPIWVHQDSKTAGNQR